MAAATTVEAEAPNIDVSGYDAPRNIAEQKELAEYLAGAKALIPPLYRGQPADILAAMWHASALNIPLATALKHLHWNAETGDGGMSAALMGALLLKGKVGYTIVALDPGKSVTMKFTRADGLTGGTCSWTIADALRAGIAGNPNWVEFPDDNLVARCLARGARWYAPDMVNGMGYTPDEVAAMRVPSPTLAKAEPVDGDVIDFLAQVTPSSTPAQIRDLIDLAHSKKINYAGMADRPAGGGMTVAQHLQAAWLAASTRTTEDPATAGAAEPEETPATPDPGLALAGDGTYPCGCPTADVLTSGAHREGCDVQLVDA